ncbi:MAG: hypothetical protein ABTQ73_05885 [Caldilineales bacterium]
MVIDGLIEGILDELVVRRVLEYTGHRLGTVFGKRGSIHLLQKMGGFNIKAQYGTPILALVDFLDTKLSCPPEVLNVWLPNRSQRFVLRVVVNEIESWLLADAVSLAKFLGIAANAIPEQVETLPDPKQVLINLARRSRSKKLREALIPSQGSSAVIGPGYNDVMGEFISQYWNIDVARHYASSLDRCLAHLTGFTDSIDYS